MARFAVTVTPRAGLRAGNHVTFTVDTSDAQSADRWGTTAPEIARAVAGDYCDSGTVVVQGDGARTAIGRSH